MLPYVIVGSGYRAEYFARIARSYPHMFRALFLCRSEEKVALVTAHTGIPATTSLQECLDFGADFAVIAVDRPHIADVAEEWLDRGYPVLAETPIADSEEKLRRLWKRREEGCRIVCCEQYHRYPILAAGLKAPREDRRTFLAVHVGAAQLPRGEPHPPGAGNPRGRACRDDRVVRFLPRDGNGFALRRDL